MLVLSLYILFWIAIPLIGLIIGARLGLPAKWRATLLYSTATVTLAVMAYFLRDPFTVFQLTIDRAYRDTYTSTGAPNYYGAYALVYGAFGLIHAGIAYMRAALSVMLTSAQFWLLHIGGLISILPMSWTIAHMQSYFDDATQTGSPGIPAPLWHTISSLGNTMSAMSVFLLLGLLLWAIWAKLRPSTADR